MWGMSQTPRPPSSPLRLTLISHALTDAQRHARFPRDEPILDTARESLPHNDFGRVDRFVCGPEQRTRQTAAALGLTCAPEPALADLDHGTWSGLSMTQCGEAELLSWLTDPGAAPHGGESVTALIARAGRWLAGLDQSGERIVAVTHPAVIRTAIIHALDAPPTAFWRIDIAPATKTVLHGRGQRWTLRTTAAGL